jgi:type II secretory pathway pseudopilin PulG
MHRSSDNSHSALPGFTLVEVLAALMFLAILVPAIVGGLTLGNRVSVLSERKAIAAELAENKLNEQLVGNSWQTSSSNTGDFGAGYPGFRWQATQQNWQGDSTNIMTELAVEVFFPVQGKDHSVRLTTLVNPNGQSASMSSPTPAPTPK